MSTTNKPIKTSSRPARTLAILALVLVAMASLVFIQGATSVRLGLDLRGGTSVTLQPRIAPGDEGKVTSEAIDQAVSIIRQRVNSLGVAESEVAAQGSGTNRQIVISVPGDTGRRVVAPTNVKCGSCNGIAVAPGPFPTMTSTRKSSIAKYSNTSVRWSRRF